MKIQRFVCNMLGENCYVASDDTLECTIIDCGAFYEEERKAIVEYIKDNKLKPQHLIATHAHIDHNLGNNTIYDNFGLKVEVSADDEYLMSRLKQQAKDFFEIEYDTIPSVGKYLRSDDIIKFGDHEFTIIPTPGHTPGSVFYYCEKENVAFSGDTLFRFSVGRTDLERGSFDDLNESLHTKVAKLPWNTTILTGHGDQTNIREEMFSNPYLGSLGIY